MAQQQVQKEEQYWLAKTTDQASIKLYYQER